LYAEVFLILSTTANMELLLNLAWALLAVPAYWLWRRDADFRAQRRGRLECLLALGCALVLLFPVISATDDLHAMRAEMEDSSASKRAVRQAESDKTSARVHCVQGIAALAVGASWVPAVQAGIFEGSVIDVSPLSRLCVLHAGRAPPFSLLV
jgi:hypothetical protein